jgi:hypothetical protein
MAYRVEHADARRESFGEYRYRIYQDDRLIAYYWHDYRGDEHGIEFVTGSAESCPVGRMTDFLEGGGPKPLRLSELAILYLDKKQK